jgi:hypothetical protein
MGYARCGSDDAAELSDERLRGARFAVDIAGEITAASPYLRRES